MRLRFQMRNILSYSSLFSACLRFAFAAELPRDVSSNAPSEGSSLDAENYQEMSISDQATESKLRKRKGRHSKYPELYRLLLSGDPSSVQINYDGNQSGAVIAQLDDKVIPINLAQIQPFHSYEASISDADPSSTKSSTEEIPKLSRHAKMKAQAIAEGRLEEFKKECREKSQRFRASRRGEDSKAVQRYEYACRRINMEALRLRDPVEAARLDKVRREKNNAASRVYYQANSEQKNLKARLKKAQNKLEKKVDISEEQTNHQGDLIHHDFDLNEPAPYEDFDDFDTSNRDDEF